MAASRISGTVAALLLGGVFTPPAWAAVIEVGPGQSIQDAVDRAGAGDTVRVRPGEYAPFRIKGSGIRVESAVPGGAHVVATGEDQPAVEAYGQSNIAVVGFRLTSRRGDGAKIGGKPGRPVSGIEVRDNVTEWAAKDGLKFFQADRVNMDGNVIRMAGGGSPAGSAGNPNGDGGIDWVQVTNSRMTNNDVSTSGWACAMVKNGSHGNTITGNRFRRCEVNGLDMAAPSSGEAAEANKSGLIAFNNVVEGNEIFGGDGCAIRLHAQGSPNNRISGNRIAGQDPAKNCNALGDTNNADMNVPMGSAGPTGWGAGGGDMGGPGTAEGMALADMGGVSGFVEPQGGCNAVQRAISAAGGILSGIFSGGRSTAPLQMAQIKQSWDILGCDAHRARTLEEQRVLMEDMVAPVGRNEVESAGAIADEMLGSVGITEEEAVRRYQDGASADMTADQSAAHFQDLRARTDQARLNALNTAAASIDADREYSAMADRVLALSQSAPGQTATLQAIAQMERAKAGRDAARGAAGLAMDHAAMLAEEETRASERLAVQRRARLYGGLSGGGISRRTSFQMFQ